MSFLFSKYVGTGNDFILIDDRDELFPLHSVNISQLCHRQYGIGADGLIVVRLSKKADAFMRIINSNGQEAEMCGNGLRCLVDFLYLKGVIKKKSHIETLNKIYACTWSKEGITIDMGQPRIDSETEEEFLINVGVPHLVVFVDHLKRFEKEAEKRFKLSGVNVNYAKLTSKGSILMRTFERGVESETLSCGTGATAVCIAAAKKFGLTGAIDIQFHSQERLRFDLLKKGKILKEIYMTGKVSHVYEGKVRL